MTFPESNTVFWANVYSRDMIVKLLILCCVLLRPYTNKIQSIYNEQSMRDHAWKTYFLYGATNHGWIGYAESAQIHSPSSKSCSCSDGSLVFFQAVASCWLPGRPIPKSRIMRLCGKEMSYRNLLSVEVSYHNYIAMGETVGAYHTWTFSK